MKKLLVLTAILMGTFPALAASGMAEFQCQATSGRIGQKGELVLIQRVSESAYSYFTVISEDANTASERLFEKTKRSCETGAWTSGSLILEAEYKLDGNTAIISSLNEN